jgi:DNA-binding transcriptional ArsR family regulator
VATYTDACWSALADRTRRTIFSRIARRPCAVGELARDLPVSRPAVSQHLKVLKDAGLVTDERDGNRRVYHVNPEGLAALRADLDKFWSAALAGFKDTVDQRTKENQ